VKLPKYTPICEARVLNGNSVVHEVIVVDEELKVLVRGECERYSVHEPNPPRLALL